MRERERDSTTIAPLIPSLDANKTVSLTVSNWIVATPNACGVVDRNKSWFNPNENARDPIWSNTSNAVVDHRALVVVVVSLGGCILKKSMTTRRVKSRERGGILRKRGLESFSLSFLGHVTSDPKLSSFREKKFELQDDASRQDEFERGPENDDDGQTRSATDLPTSDDRRPQPLVESVLKTGQQGLDG